MKYKILLLSLIILLGSCRNIEQVYYTHQMYIWQRIWTPELHDAVSFWNKELAGLRVLTGYFSDHLNSRSIAVDWSHLKSNKLITQVYRVNGTKLPEVKVISNLINQNIKKSRQHSLTIETIEIDFDSPTSKLNSYANWLETLKKDLPKEIQLSITTLPTWQNSKDLLKLIKSVDHYVLQIHSADSPEIGLINFNKAEQWINSFNSKLNKPFHISIPSYWYQAALDKNNKIKAILAEGQSIDANHSIQIFAEPKAIHDLMLKTESAQLKNLQGWVWFRMPTQRDNQVFSEQTIKKIMNTKQQLKIKPVQIFLESITEGELTTNYDVYINNPESIEQSFDSLALPENCTSEHLIQGFHHSNSTIQAQNPALFKANESKRVGWVKCAN